MDEDKCSRVLRISYRVIALVLISSYTVCVAVIVPDYHQALPFICITCFVVFCLCYHYIKKKFGDQVSEKISKISTRIKWMKTRQFSIGSYIVVVLACICYLVISNLDTIENLISIAGLVVLIGASWLISYNRRQINWRPVIWGIVLQMVLGLLILRTEAGRKTFSFLGKQVEHFQSHVLAGVNFVFGEKYGDFEFIFKLMPTVIFINSVVSVLYHFGLMQMLVEKCAVAMHFTMGTTAAETVCTAASMFLGQPEASFAIKPYLSLLTKSELFAIMTAGFASVSADIFGLFVKYGISSSDILTAVLMSAPAGLAVSKIICPETEESKTKTWRQIKNIHSSSESANVIEAAAKGAQDAMFVVLTVIACLISFLSILSFLNAALAYLGSLVGLSDLSLNIILSYVMMPLVFVMGVPWEDCKIVGEVVGLKTVVNEFVGYTRLGEYIKIEAISTKSKVIATYALCGFSNPMTMGVIVGGLSVLIPEKKNLVAEIVVRAWIAGCIACFMTACFAGLLYDEVNQPILNNATLTSNYTLTTVSSYSNVSK